MLESRLDSEIKERIYDPTVATVYSEWIKRGLLTETITVLTKVPQPVVEPFLHSFTTHVHKEKGLFLESFSFPFIQTLFKKITTQQFLGGRLGYSKELLFFWLICKKIANWDFRTVASMAGVSHPTLIRANQLFF